jgi:hypothetical protein
MLIFRDNAGGKYYGSIFTDYNGGTGGRGITVEDLTSGEDSRARLEAGQLVLSNNIWFNFAAGNDLASFAPQDFVQAHFTANNNQIVDPQLASISRQHDGQLDPRPAAGSPALSGATQPADAFFADVDYYGAFDPNAPLWTNGWSALFQERISTKNITTDIKEVNRNDGAIPSSFELGQNYPNPFNPATNINYAITKTGPVKLTVYNLLGQAVATLVDGVRMPGSYTLTWNAANLSSGVYVYQLQAGSTLLTKRMLLLK